jgi:hypothetical protein
VPAPTSATTATSTAATTTAAASPTTILIRLALTTPAATTLPALLTRLLTFRVLPKLISLLNVLPATLHTLLIGLNSLLQRGHSQLQFGHVECRVAVLIEIGNQHLGHLDRVRHTASSTTASSTTTASAASLHHLGLPTGRVASRSCFVLLLPTLPLGLSRLDSYCDQDNDRQPPHQGATHVCIRLS